MNDELKVIELFCGTEALLISIINNGYEITNIYVGGYGIDVYFYYFNSNNYKERVTFILLEDLIGKLLGED